MNGRLVFRSLAVALALSVLGVAAGCGSDDDATSTAATEVTVTETIATESTETGTETTGTVDAHTASIDELAAAFAAADIDNAEKWAAEVDEYRPYPTDDPTFAKLRQELAKYNPAPGVVDAIVATLTL